MAMVSGTVKIDLRGLKKFERTVATDLRGSGRGPIRDAIKQWAARYRSFVQRRFARFSRGGGNWLPLKRKRTRGNKSKASVLRDTNTLFAALEPQFKRKPGQLEKSIPFGVRVGFGGPSKHPTGRASVADIAEFHQTGAGNLPVRAIIVGPDRATIVGMASDMERAMLKLAGKTINAPR